MSNTRILVVDDEPQILKYVRANLVASGYQPLVAHSGQAAVAIARVEDVDLIVLDLSMPDLDGFQVCQQIRSSALTPILVLSARTGDGDKVKALDLGADDYLTKPFSPEELLARIRALLRRSQKAVALSPARPLRFGAVTFDLETRRVTRDGEPVRLTRTESELLYVLVTNAGRVLTHRMLLQQVWGPEYGDENEYLWAYVRRLRCKLEPDEKQPRLILTEPGVGYRCPRPAPPSEPDLAVGLL